MNLRFLALLSIPMLVFSLVSCAPVAPPQGSEAAPTMQASETPVVASTEAPFPSTEALITEQPVHTIELVGPVSVEAAEISGLAWYGDHLIILPQYPDAFDSAGDGFLYTLRKDEIIAYIDGRTTTPLEPRPIQLIAPVLRASIPRYQGFEAIGFSGDRVFLTIEAGSDEMMGYLISGTIAPDLSTLTLDTAKLTQIPPQASFANRADEAILVFNDRVVTFYEINGVAVNPNPIAHVFGYDLQSQGTLYMPNIEYRLTDAALISDDQFWAINYFFPGDLEQLPAADPIIDAFGEGPTHVENIQVERLLKFQITEAGVALIDTPPVQLVLSSEIRNWEGLVLLDDRGFLLATDKYPATLLAFVPLPE